MPCCDVRTPLAGEPARGGGVWWRARLGGEEYCNLFYRDEYDLVGFLSERGLGESERIFGIFALVVETHKEGDREREGDTERAEQAAGTRNLTNEWINELNFLSTLAEDAYLKERPASQTAPTSTLAVVFFGESCSAICILNLKRKFRIHCLITELHGLTFFNNFFLFTVHLRIVNSLA